MVPLSLSLMLALALPTGQPAAGQTVTAGDAMTRARALTGAATCPRGAARDTITVCGRRGEDPYRIPDVIRAEPQPRKAGAATAWGTRNDDLEEAARSGRAGSSSPDGSGGQSGWAQKLRREWDRERQAIDARTATPPER